MLSRSQTAPSQKALWTNTSIVITLLLEIKAVSIKVVRSLHSKAITSRHCQLLAMPAVPVSHVCQERTFPPTQVHGKRETFGPSYSFLFLIITVCFTSEPKVTFFWT